MTNKKKSSIEWLLDEMLRIEKQNHPRSVALKLFFESHGILISKAKEMHKQEIMDSFDIRKIDIAFDKKTTSVQYYTDTFEP